MKGKVQTVCGLVDPETLGRTLTHEHLHMQFNVSYVPAPPQYKHMETCDMSLPNLGWIRQNPYSHKGNLILNDVASMSAVMDEMALFKERGGGTIVENSTKGLDRNLGFMKEITKKHGVHVIAGTGYYVKDAQKAETLGVSIEWMVDFMTKEITVGCEDNQDIRCGIIGEIGCSWPLYDFERLAIKAAGETQAAIGCPVMIHPGRHHDGPAEIVRIYAEAGGAVNKLVMAHLDRTIAGLEALVEFASLGSYCEYDLFGIEVSHYMHNPGMDMPSDGQRIARIKHLIDHGFGDKMVIAQDIHTKHRLTAYGGHGYSHIFENVVPKMLDRGFCQEDVDKILIDNPKAWLTFTK